MFPGALEEVVLLFADGRNEGECAGTRVFEYQDLDGLSIPELESELAAPRPPATSHRGKHAKLLAQLLPSDARFVYDEMEHPRREDVGGSDSVDIGAVTGANNFFLLRAGEHPELSEELLRPTVSKAVHVRGARLRPSDFRQLLATNVRCQLFVADLQTPPELLETARSFLAEGEKLGYPTATSAASASHGGGPAPEVRHP